MGDLLEYTSVPKIKLRFYRITSGALKFSVKGEKQYRGYYNNERPAAVGLARRPGDKCDYWIVIKKHEFCLLKNESQVSHKEVPDLFTGNEFDKFWISWHSAKLQFGRTSDGIPLISKKLLVPNIQYVTFCSYGDRGSLEWKVFLPPNLDKLQFKEVTSNENHWVKSDGHLPDGAMIGGFEKEILYIIRAKVGPSMVPGLLIPSEGTGYITYAQYVHKINTFEVLCGFNYIWIPSSNGGIPLGAVEGGYDGLSHETLYIGRAVVNGNLLPGKVQASEAVCSVSHDMHEFCTKNYEILVDPHMLSQNPNFPSLMDRIEEYFPRLDLEENSGESSSSEV